MKRISLLPNLLTLAGCTCGLLAISKGIDAIVLAQSGADLLVFYRKLETAAQLIFLAMLFDALDGKVARMTDSASDLGAQLDSLSDAIAFGVAPALLAKILIDHEAPAFDFPTHPRLVFFGCGLFALLAVLRLARFNLESDNEEESHQEFRGLPTPAAAGVVASTILLYLSLREPRIETVEGTPTLVGQGLSTFGVTEFPMLPWFLPLLGVMLPVLGFLMISRVPYSHMFSLLTRGKVKRLILIGVVVAAFVLSLAPVLSVFLLFNGYVLFGVGRAIVLAFQGRRGEEGASRHA